MNSLIANSTACGAIAESALVFCKQVSEECPRKIDSTESIFLLVAIPLMILAFAETLGSCGNGLKTFQLLYARRNAGKVKVLFLQVEDGSNRVTHYEKESVQKIIREAHKIFKKAAQISVLVAIAYLIFNAPFALQKACPDHNSCLSFSVKAFNGCETAQQWLLEIIEDLIHGGAVNCRQLSSIAD